MTNHTAQGKVENLAEPLARNGQNAKAVPLAAELAISPDEIQNWLSGETPLTLEDGIWPRVFRTLRDRREKLTRVHDEIHSAFQAANNRAEEGGKSPKATELPVKPLHILR